jgi:hypothetical protein
MKCAILFCFVFPAFVTAENMIRYLLNNGNLTGTSIDTACNADDVAYLDFIFNINNLPKLRSRLMKDIEIDVHELDFENDVINRNQERELAYFPPHCKNNCKYYAAGMCMATSCVGYRRELGGKANQTKSRGLQYQFATWCENAAYQISGYLYFYRTRGYFSKPCMTLMALPMKIECYNDIIYGVIESFSVYNSTPSTDILLKSAAPNGLNVCSSTRIAIKAEANDCVASVQFTLTGPNAYNYARNESSSPFSLFSRSGLKLSGMVLPLGTYKLSAVPDGYLQKKQNFTFNVVKC